MIKNVVKNLGDSELTYQQEVVLEFIDDFSTFFNTWSIENYEELRKLFTQGFCWQFAKMLQATFDRGTVCMAFPKGHMVWVDDDGTAYDIDGIDITECYYYIPEEYLGNQIINFKHIPHKWVIPATREEVLEIAKRYCTDNNIEIDPQLVEELSK